MLTMLAIVLRAYESLLCLPIPSTLLHRFGLNLGHRAKGGYVRNARTHGFPLNITTTETAKCIPDAPCIPTSKAVLTAQELSQIVPLHPVTILRWAREGRIPCRRLSARKIVFLPSEINAWLESGSTLYADPVGHAAQPERTAA